ncbi:MAG: hypothetical protein JWR85_3588 [Marmoricola sp.]|nr:hypothetical protein [Marmoricola sp.]
MALCRVIVNSALRKLGRLGAGREPRTADAADTLEALRGMYSSWIASGALGRLQDVVPTGTNYTAMGGDRIYRQSAATLSVTLPELVSEASGGDYGDGHRAARYYGTIVTISTVGGVVTVDVQPAQPIGYATPPRDGAPVVISDAIGGQTLSWIYDGTAKQWQPIKDLRLEDDAPRSSADPEGLAAMLALEVADKFGIDVSPFTMRAAARFQTALTSRLGMRREAVAGNYY